MKIFPLTFIFAFFFADTTYSQDTTKPKKQVTEMNTDMPDETQETDLVDKGQLQVETGILYNRYKTGRSSVVAQGLVRYGIAKRLEIRLLMEDGKERDRYIKETVQSTYPFAAGAKLSVVKDVKGLPDITLVSYIRLPITNRSSDQKAYWSPILLAAFQNKFGHDKWKLEYNAGAQQEAYGTEWAAIINASLHYKFTEKLEVYTEYFSQFQPGEKPQHNMGGGVAYEVGNALEFYISAGGTIHNPEQNHFFNGGVAFRIPE